MKNKKDLYIRNKDDKLKKHLCKKNNVLLFSIYYTRNVLELYDFIKIQLSKIDYDISGIDFDIKILLIIIRMILPKDIKNIIDKY